MVLFQFYYGGGGAFASGMMLLQNLGLFDLLLPFVLLFTVFFAILQRMKLFIRVAPQGKTLNAEDEKHNKAALRYNAVIALSMAGLVVGSSVMGYNIAGIDAVKVINDALPQFTVALLGVVLLFIIVAIGGGNSVGGIMKRVIPIGAGLFVLSVIYNAVTQQTMPWWIAQFITDPSIVILVVMVAVGYFVVSFIFGETKKDKDKDGNEFNDDLGFKATRFLDGLKKWTDN